MACLALGVAAFLLQQGERANETPGPAVKQAPASSAEATGPQAADPQTADPQTADPQTADHAPTAWIEDVAKAERLARATGKPLLFYVSPSATCCPAAAHLDQGLLADAKVHELGDLCIPVRLRLDRPDSAADAALDKMRLRLTPALVVMSPEGRVLRRQYARLYPAFDGSGEPMPGDWGQELSLDDLRTWITSDLAPEASPARVAPSPQQTALLDRLTHAEAHRNQGDRQALEQDLTWLRKQLGQAPRAPEPWAPASLFRLASLEMMPEHGLVERAEKQFRLLMHTWPDSFEAQQMKHGLLDEMKRMVPPPKGAPPAPDTKPGSP